MHTSPMPPRQTGGKLQNVQRTPGGFLFDYLAAHHLAAARVQPQYWQQGRVSRNQLLNHITENRLYIIPAGNFPDSRPVELSPADYMARFYKRALQSYLDSRKEEVQWI